MSEVKIKRRFRTVNVTLSTSTSAASTLRMDDMAGAVVSLGTMSTNASTQPEQRHVTETCHRR